MQITKENYKDLVWDENIPNEEYNDFFQTLEVEEKVDFIKFLVEKYPDFDNEWMFEYLNIAGQWEMNCEYDKVIEFADFIRSKGPTIYKKEFTYLDSTPILYALFYDELEKVKSRFKESVEQPVKAIDDTLRRIFNILSTDSRHNKYVKEVAEKVWKKLATSDELLGGAEFNYNAFLYCDLLASTFDTIQTGETVDWEAYKVAVREIEFKYIEELTQLPNADVVIEDEEQFHAKKIYRQDIVNNMALPFFYYAHTEAGIPLYWAFRSWWNIIGRMLEGEDASNRKNWFTFTPKMIDKLGGNLHGIFGGNQAEMLMTLYGVPYVYDYFLKQQYIDDATFQRLMENYDYVRRNLFEIAGGDFWQYKGLYTWKKPNYLSAERYEQEKALMLESINWTQKEGRQKMKAYIATLPPLPKYVIPSIEPSPFEKLFGEISPKKKVKKKRQGVRKRRGRRNKRK